MSFWPDMKLMKKMNASTVFEFKIYAEKAQIALCYGIFFYQRTQQMGKVCIKCLKYELFSKSDVWPKFCDQ